MLKNLDLGYICKAVNSVCKSYVIFCLINQLKPIWAYFRNKLYQVIFVFLLRFLRNGIFETLYKYSS